MNQSYNLNKCCGEKGNVLIIKGMKKYSEKQDQWLIMMS